MSYYGSYEEPCPWGNTPKNLERWRLLQTTTRWLQEQEYRRGRLDCEYCGSGPLRIFHWTEAPDHTMATVDHVIPRARGGPDHPSNFRVSCRPCNSRKADKMPGQWN